MYMQYVAWWYFAPGAVSGKILSLEINLGSCITLATIVFSIHKYYSGIFLERPPHWTCKCGLSIQVVFGNRFNYIDM